MHFRPAPALVAAAILAGGALAPAAPAAAAAAFSISLSFSGLSASQQAAVTDAATTWESVITGYRADALFSGVDAGTAIGAVELAASVADLGGAGGELAQGGVASNLTSDNGLVYAASGFLRIDSADIADLEADGTLTAIAMHEIAHALGYGILWTANGLAPFGSGQYLGVEALAQYQADYDPLAPFVPVELDGGAGTANRHWDENWAGPSTALMTGYFQVGSALTNVSIASFADLGYTVALMETPLPGAGALLAGGLGLLALGRRRGDAAAG